MLASIRKFSNSIYSKILLGIIIIPFVFWGMGSSFVGGNKNIVVVIDKEKYSTQDFVNFIQTYASTEQKINVSQVEELLSHFIGEKLIDKEIDYLKIKLTDNSLSELIKHQKKFKRKNKFSRIEYEKFLLKNNISAAFFEANLSKNEKKKQLLNFIGGGVFPPKFLVNNFYDRINQKRDVQIINLSELFKKKFNFTEDQIKSYYKNNKNNYKQIYKSVKILELNPKTLTGNDEFDDSFFNKIDEIDDLIIRGNNLDHIILEFNLKKPSVFTLDEFGKDINSKIINNLPQSLLKNIFAVNNAEPTALVEKEDKYFILEVFKTENIEKGPTDKSVREKLLSNLQMKTKRVIISEIISKINQSAFTKSDFDKLSKDNNVAIRKVNFKNQNDNQLFGKELLDQIYSFTEKKIFVTHDMDLTKNFLIYIDRIEHAAIDEKSEDYKKYINLSKSEITNKLLNTYDNYIRKRYKIDINYKALDTVKNYFN